MGTRGFIGFAVRGQTKLVYNHFDSYPEYLGVNVYKTLKRWLSSGEIEHRAEQAYKLEAVAPGSKPTAEDRERLRKYSSPGVGEPGSWYELLRETQGDLDMTLDAGVYEEAGDDWPRDSLFCEWGYLVDLDGRKLEVYEGFQRERPRAGRWKDGDPSGDYYPVALIATFPFGALPEDEEEFLRVVKEAAKGNV